MGYPMTWSRIKKRNHVDTGYEDYKYAGDDSALKLLRGDLLRFRNDMTDELHLKLAQRDTGIAIEDIRLILDWLFKED